MFLLDKRTKGWKNTKTEDRKVSGHKNSVPHDALAQIVGKRLNSFATDFWKNYLNTKSLHFLLQEVEALRIKKMNRR